jgi:hypothetical protein
MLQVKQAVERAKEYLPDIFETAAGRELNLEGVELTSDSKFWTVTFSYVPPRERYAGRDYKTLKLRAEDGEFFGARDGLTYSDTL